MSGRPEYARAFVRQARADFDTYLRLRELRASAPPSPGHSSLGPVPHSHCLHFLQMTCEKLAKAFIAWRLRYDPGTLRRHNCIAEGFVPLTREVIRRNQTGKRGDLGPLISEFHRISREIEALSPSLETASGGKRPDNCEYPWEWEEGAGFVLPCEYTFPNLERLERPSGAGPEFIRFIGTALTLLEKELGRGGAG